LHPLQKSKIFVPTQLSIFLQWQSKIVDPSFPSILYSFFIYIIEPVLVLNFTEILIAGRSAMNNISINLSQLNRCLSFCTFSFGYSVLLRYTDSDCPFGIFKHLLACSTFVRRDIYPIQPSVIKHVSYLRKVVDFLQILHFHHKLMWTTM